jgi:EAL domain-containing protein (putative c-di-GMP-specific phosphodiesterase class I)
VLPRLSPWRDRHRSGGLRQPRDDPGSALKLGLESTDDNSVEGARTALLPDCRPLLAHPDDLTLVFQPIVDLARAIVAGYQAMARFPGTAGPDVWFDAAEDAGIRSELEALALHKALAVVDALPPQTFLTVRISPHVLGSASVQEALASLPDLTHVVVELTEHIPVSDLAALREQCAELRRRGALIALDDAASGYSGLKQLAALRPQVVTLDGALVADADADPVSAALAETLSEFAGRIDARMLAVGLETAGELAACARLGVPLAQGWLLGRPAPTFQPLAPEVAALVEAQVARARLTDTVAGLLRPVRQVMAEDAGDFPPAVVLGVSGEPVGLLLGDLRTGQSYAAPVSLSVAPSADIVETLQRALSRPPAQRFDPVLCTNAAGAVLGLLRVEDLAAAHPKR